MNSQKLYDIFFLLNFFFIIILNLQKKKRNGKDSYENQHEVMEYNKNHRNESKVNICNNIQNDYIVIDCI